MLWGWGSAGVSLASLAPTLPRAGATPVSVLVQGGRRSISEYEGGLRKRAARSAGAVHEGSCSGPQLMLITPACPHQASGLKAPRIS